MDLTIRTKNNQNIALTQGVAAGDYYNLPGSSSWFSETQYGNLYFQEKQSGPFTIRLSFLKILRNITLNFLSQTPRAGVRLALENQWNVGLQTGDAVKLQQNQFVLFSPGTKGEKMVFEEGQQYRGIEILCDPERLGDLMDLFPGIAEYVGEGENDHSIFLQRKPLWAPHRVLDIVNELVGLGTGGNLFLLMNFLMMQVEHVMEDKLPTLEEIEAVDKAHKLILKDMRAQYAIPSIASRVKLNETRLKYVFRHVFKTNIYQYMLGARMEKAKYLLQHTKRPMEEIATQTGYRYLTKFIIAYRKYHGIAPRAVDRTADKQ
jgi:AraC-like DNA-binding protein